MPQTITTLPPLQGPRLTAQQRLIALFSCCMKSHVVFRPASARIESGKVRVDYVTRQRGPSASDWHKHFAGTVALNLAPNLAR